MSIRRDLLLRSALLRLPDPPAPRLPMSRGRGQACRRGPDADREAAGAESLLRRVSLLSRLGPPPRGGAPDDTEG